MTLQEIRLALKELEGAYTLRLYLDNAATVLAHQWTLMAPPDGDAGAPEAGGEAGLLCVRTAHRKAVIAVSRIVVIQEVPFGG